MSTTAGQNGVTLSPVDYVRNLSAEDKGKVFVSLLREAIESSRACGVMPIDDEEGNSFGYYVPPRAAEAIVERELPKLTPEREQELRVRTARLHTAIPMSQAVAELKQKAEQLQTQRP